MTHEQFIQVRFLKTVENLSSIQIAEKLGLKERTIRDWWNLSSYPSKEVRESNTILETFIPRIESLLKDCPSLSGTQIYQKLRSFGYCGSPSTVRRFVNKARPVPKHSFLPLNFDPGEALQVDFGDCGYLQQGNRKIRLCICACVLCYSRLLFAKLIPSEKQEYTFAFLMDAFQFFGGVPRRIVVDNFKGAVLHHPKGGNAEYHPAFLDFCAHYGIIPHACNVRAPNEKGRIENGIGYIKGNFMRGSRFHSLEEAQCSLQNWLETIANVRIHNTTKRRPIDLFNEKEKMALLPLNPYQFDCSRIEERHVDSRCRFKFEGSHYSVPAICAGQNVSIRITPDRIHVYMDKRQITSHKRAVERNTIVDDPNHFKVMLDERQTAARQNLLASFLALDEDAAVFKNELESRAVDTTQHIKKIMTLVNIWGKDIVVRALQSAVSNKVYGAEYIEYIIRLKQHPAVPIDNALHVTNGADKLAMTLNQPDLSVYEQ
jgi:Transposase and inactivated derivatives